MEEIFKKIKLSKKKILIIGDVMVDKYSFGNFDRKSNEVPLTIFDVKKETMVLGGAGNLYSVIQGFGFNCDICCLIGEDTYGDFILSKIENAKFIYRIENFNTTVKHRFYNHNNQIFRSDSDFRSENMDYIKIYNDIEKNINKYDLIFISDYNKGFISEEFCKKIIQLCKKNKIRVFADSKDDNLNKFIGLDTLKINKNEYEKISRNRFSNIDDEKNNINEILDKYKIKSLLLTLGESGLYLIEKNNYYFSPAIKVDNSDVIGAGDCVDGAFAICQLLEIDKQTTVDFLTKTSSYVVSNIGTVGFSSEKYQQMEKTSNKLVEIDDLRRISINLKRENKKLVFTNGCFDVIHVGHLKLLSEAKKLGDELVVAINSDESIKKIKGERRPINNIDHRIEFLKYFPFINYIIVFNDETPEKLIEFVSPSVLVKGRGYKKENIIGHDFIIENGGEVVILDFNIDISSTKIIEKLGETQ